MTTIANYPFNHGYTYVGKMKSTKVQTLGELRMCGIPKIDGLGYLRLLAVSR